MPLRDLIRLGSFLVLILLLMVSCRHSAEVVNNQTLTLAVPPEEIVNWRKFCDRFEQENPGARVNLIEAPKSASAHETLITTALLSGQASDDLFYLDVIWTPKFAAAGWLEDLSDLLPASELQDFLAGDIAACRYQGKLYRVPVRSDAGMLYYRKDILDQAGLVPPKTFPELVTIAKQLQKPPQLWGYAWQGKQYEGLVCNYLEILSGMGGYWVNPANREVGLDQPAAIAALEFLRNAVLVDQISPPGVTSYEEEEGRQLFQQGGVIFLRNWPYCWNIFQRDDSPVKGKVGVVPMVYAGQGRSAATLGGWGLALSRFSPRKALAKKFIQFMARADIQQQFILQTGFVPVRHSLYRDTQLLAKFPFYQDLYAVELSGVPRPPIPQYAAVSDILQRYASSALSDRLTVTEALNRAAKETRGRVQ